jgi:hypothetical protein
MATTARNLKTRKRKVFRAIFGIFSLSGILFAFQACYGTPQDFGQDILITGKVTSATTKTPITGIKVLINESGQYSTTASDGTFSMYCERMAEYKIVFSDIDGDQNGRIVARDTIVKRPDMSESLTVNIELK